MHLQFLDMRHSAMFDLQLPEADPIRRCLRELSVMLTQMLHIGPVRAVYMHCYLGQGGSCVRVRGAGHIVVAVLPNTWASAPRVFHLAVLALPIG